MGVLHLPFCLDMGIILDPILSENIDFTLQGCIKFALKFDFWWSLFPEENSWNNLGSVFPLFPLSFKKDIRRANVFLSKWARWTDEHSELCYFSMIQRNKCNDKYLTASEKIFLQILYCHLKKGVFFLVFIAWRGFHVWRCFKWY